jgi:hypothetical protein
MVMVVSQDVRVPTDVAARIRFDFLAPAAVARSAPDMCDWTPGAQEIGVAVEEVVVEAE